MSPTVPTIDQHLTCRECGQPFTRGAAEQNWYAQHAARPPDTCPACRARRRAERSTAFAAAHDPAHSSDAHSRERRHGGARPFGRSGAGGSEQRYRAICDDCGRETEVPFRPRSGRPVFCQDCFNARRGR